ncbi:MAG: cation:dicarboxylase symporter family transporter, partial [candidate division Zixibacteria bacterium]
MNQITNVKSPLWILAGVITGAIAGYFSPNAVLPLNFIGTIFLAALTFLAGPLVIINIIAAVTALGDNRKLIKASAKTLLYFIGTSALAAAAGIAVSLIFSPGSSVAQSLTTGGALQAVDAPGFWTAFSSITTMGVLLAIVAVMLFGAAMAVKLPRPMALIGVLKEIQELLYKLLDWVTSLAPVGLAVLTAVLVANNQAYLTANLSGLSYLLGVVLIGLALHLFLFLPALLFIAGYRKPYHFLANLLPAMSTALATGSSLATLPVLFDNVLQRNKLDHRAVGIVLPLGASLNMNGSALFLAASSVFVLQYLQIPLDIVTVLIVAGASVVVSITLAGLSLPSLWGMAAVAGLAGIDGQALAVMASLASIAWIIERVGGVVDVASDAVGAAMIAESFDFKTVGRRGAATQAQRKPSRFQRPATPERGRHTGRDSKRPDRVETRNAPSSRQQTDRPSHGKPERRRRGRDDQGGRPGGRRSDDRKAPPRPSLVGKASDRSEPTRSESGRQRMSRDRRVPKIQERQPAQQKPTAPQVKPVAPTVPRKPSLPIQPTPAPAPVVPEMAVSPKPVKIDKPLAVTISSET